MFGRHARSSLSPSSWRSPRWWRRRSSACSALRLQGDAEIAAASRGLCAADALMADRRAADWRRGSSAAVTGTGDRLARHHVRISRAADMLWLLPLPLAIPTYIGAYVYADLLDVGGPVQSAAARAVRHGSRPPIMVSADPIARRRDLHHGRRALSLHLSRHAGDVSDPDARLHRCRAHARRKALVRSRARYRAAGAAGARRRHRARPCWKR